MTETRQALSAPLSAYPAPPNTSGVYGVPTPPIERIDERGVVRLAELPQCEFVQDSVWYRQTLLNVNFPSAIKVRPNPSFFWRRLYLAIPIWDPAESWASTIVAAKLRGTLEGREVFSWEMAPSVRGIDTLPAVSGNGLKAPSVPPYAITASIPNGTFPSPFVKAVNAPQNAIIVPFTQNSVAPKSIGVITINPYDMCLAVDNFEVSLTDVTCAGGDVSMGIILACYSQNTKF